MSRPPTILCAVDDSPDAPALATFAGRLAMALGVRLVLAHVFDPMWVPMPPSREHHLVQSTEALEESERRRARVALAATAQTLQAVDHSTVFAEGTPTAEILRLAREHDARLLVTGSPARKPFDRVLKGSLSAEVAVRAPCPVVVVTDDADVALDGPVLVAYDGSDHSQRAARHGAALASALGRELLLMHVVESDEPGVEASADLALELHDAARSCAAELGRAAGRLEVTVLAERGDPVEQLTRTARDRAASLVVVGSRGRNAVKAALLGSVSAGMVRAAGRPVVVAGPGT